MSEAINGRYMRPETLTIIDDLKNTRLFRSVGEPVEDRNTIVVQSWAQAIKSAGRLNWENLRIEWGNTLSGRLAVEFPARFDQWNEVTIELKRLLLPIVDEKIAAVELDEKLRTKLLNSVRWDLLSLLQESEYSDLVTPHYYAALGAVYFDGHFPCGWEGEYPDGKFIVF